MSSSCTHEHLKFQDGTYKIACIDCDRTWVAQFPGTSEALDLRLKSQMAAPGRETRHDRFSLPRMTKKTG